MTDRKQNAIQSTVITPPSATLALLLALLIPGIAAEPSQLSQTYKDIRMGLIIQYPAGWRLDTLLFQGFNIIDFPPDKRPPQAFVPMGHADIGVFSPPESEKAIAEWMRKERIKESQGDHISETTLATKHLGALSVTVARSQSGVIPDATSLVYFFEVEGRPLNLDPAVSQRG